MITQNKLLTTQLFELAGLSGQFLLKATKSFACSLEPDEERRILLELEILSPTEKIKSPMDLKPATSLQEKLIILFIAPLAHAFLSLYFLAHATCLLLSAIATADYFYVKAAEISFMASMMSACLSFFSWLPNMYDIFMISNNDKPMMSKTAPSETVKKVRFANVNIYHEPNTYAEAEETSPLSPTNV